MSNYDQLDFSQEELSAAMRRNYDRIISFITTPEFKALHDEMRSLPPAKRPSFVERIILNSAELRRRGVVVPEDILIQTSAFGDRRPTLFVVKIFLPSKFHCAWENTNITFDNEYDDNDVPRSPEMAWRAPLRVDVQASLISKGIDLNSAVVNDLLDAD